MKILWFDLCALPIFIIIEVSLFVRKTTRGAANRLFIHLVIVAFLTALCDVITEYISKGGGDLNTLQMVVGRISIYAYFLLRTLTAVVYLFFLFAITRASYRFSKGIMHVVVVVPYVIEMLLLLVNGFTGWIFTYTREDGYSRGPFILILYAISMMYAIGGTVYLASCRPFLEKGKWAAMMSMYVITFTAVGVQYFHERYMVEMFGTALSILIVAFLVLRPEEIMDQSVGLPTFRAYRQELDKIIKTRQKVKIVVIKFINANDIRAYLGEQVYHEYIKAIARVIVGMCVSEKLSWEIYFEHPGCLYLLLDNYEYDVERAIPGIYRTIRNETRQIMDTGAKLVPRICVIRCPEDIAVRDDILHFGHEFHGLFPYEQVFSRASDIVGSLDFEIKNNMDKILNRAITGNKLEMYYQPIYALQKKRFASAEALIRLRDEEFGFVSPGLFIPAAERKGLMLAIGDFVLESVFRFASECDFAALGLEYVEINLSLAQCMDRSLPARVRALQEKYGVLPERINFEILETTYESITTIADKNIRELSEMGYSFSLDDYGTGYSNIQRVVSLPLKIIKLDKCFVDALHTENGLSILRDTVRTMQSISKELVVEGVETKEAVDQLDAMRCDFIQGFYYSKPLPESEFIAFLRRHNG